MARVQRPASPTLPIQPSAPSQSTPIVWRTGALVLCTQPHQATWTRPSTGTTRVRSHALFKPTPLPHLCRTSAVPAYPSPANAHPPSPSPSHLDAIVLQSADVTSDSSFPSGCITSGQTADGYFWGVAPSHKGGHFNSNGCTWSDCATTVKSTTTPRCFKAQTGVTTSTYVRLPPRMQLCSAHLLSAHLLSATVCSTRLLLTRDSLYPFPRQCKWFRHCVVPCPPAAPPTPPTPPAPPAPPPFGGYFTVGGHDDLIVGMKSWLGAKAACEGAGGSEARWG